MQPEDLKSEIEKTSVRIPGFVICFFCCLLILTEFFRTLPGAVWLGDLGSFIESGWAATAKLNPYGTYPLSLRSQFPGFDLLNPNMNPPISVLLFRLFTFARPETVFRQWYMISVLMYAGIVWLMVKRYPEIPRRVLILWMVSLASFWETLSLGQIYVPLMGIGIFGWLLIEKKRDLAAGICLGIFVAIKPQFLLWPLLLLLARHYRISLVSFLTATLISLIPLLKYGPVIYRQWFDMLVLNTPQRIPFITNTSLSGLFARMGMTRFGMMLGLGLCLALCVWAVWKRPDAIKASAFGIVASFLSAPIAWMSYGLILAPLLLSRWDNEKMRFIAFCLCTPILMVLSALGALNWIQFTVGSIYGWSIILLMILLMMEEWDFLAGKSESDPAGRHDKRKVRV